jgi:hypothetical protein
MNPWSSGVRLPRTATVVVTLAGDRTPRSFMQSCDAVITHMAPPGLSTATNPSTTCAPMRSCTWSLAL